MVYLMRCCDPAHKAAHFAILTALMSVSFTIAGVASGFLANALGKQAGALVHILKPTIKEFPAAVKRLGGSLRGEREAGRRTYVSCAYCCSWHKHT